MNYKDFKSGSDIRGFGLGENSNPLYLSDEAVTSICFGFADWLSRHCKKALNELTVSVGHDSRLSAQRIKSAVIDALTSVGINIKDCALCSTPAMFMTTICLGCDGAVQITASHHPKDRNGLKFFTAGGGLNGSEIEAILNFAENQKTMDKAEEKGAVESVDFLSQYAESLRKMICEGVNAADYAKPLKGYKIVVDAGNGVGGFYAYKVLEPLVLMCHQASFLNLTAISPIMLQILRIRLL
jgi:phosphomannomutase